MAINNSVSSDFSSTFVDTINVFDCHLPGVRRGTLEAPFEAKLFHFHRDTVFFHGDTVFFLKIR